MEQKTALGMLKTGRNVYLTGAAGSGKTFVLNEYIKYLRKNNVGVGVTASTGIAATHLSGMTIHSWSGIGIKDYLSDWDIDSMTQRQPLVKRFERTDVLLVDEVSMLRPEFIDMIDQVARAMKRVDSPFGGMQVIFSGDFFQLPPVVKGGSSDSFADSSNAWLNGDIRACYLTEQFRQEGGQLLDILNDIRDGEISVQTQESLESRMSNEDIEDVENNAVVLNTHNADVDERNAKELKKIDGKVSSYKMVSTGRANLVETLKKGVLVPETLQLKVGAQVMFVKNSPDQEYANGTLGEVIDVSGAYPVVETQSGNEIVASPMSWEIIDDGKVLASVSQVPLRLAWAITIHKSQGMSLDTVEVDLSRAFTPGQGYVALSRARTLSGLTLQGLNATALQVHPYVSARDAEFQAESVKWENIYSKFSKVRILELETEFLSKVARSDSEVVSMPTHLKTRALLEEGKTLEEIAKERSMTKGTIVSHLEKLKAEGDTYEHLMDDNTDVILEAFKKTKEYKLAPVHRLLKGKYTYDEIKLARVFIS